MSKASEEAKESRLWQPVTVKWFAALFGGALAYAIVRYHVAEGVEWSHFPLFILNKAVSLAAVFFVASSYLVGRVLKWHNHDPRIRLIVVKFCGLMGLSFAAIHAFMSLALWSASYYPAYFLEGGRLNLWGELAITLGAVGLWALAIPGITTLPTMAKSLGGFRWKRSQRAGYVALTLVAAHLAALGFRGWLDPSRWPAGLPPISLLAFLAAAFTVLLKARSRLDDE
jgi:DMSO/TMAO reductase YedYZ heme-binding membrane subunit